MSDQGYEFSLGPGSGTKVFHTLTEIEDWLNEERTFWASFEQAASRDRELSGCWQPFRQFFRQVSQQLTTAKDSERSAQQDKREFDPNQFLDSLKIRFQQAYETERLIASTSPRAKFLHRLEESYGVSVALYAAGYFTEQDIPLDRNHTKTLHDCLRGVLEASYHEHGFTERIVDEKQALQELRSEWEKAFQAFEKSLREETEKHQKLNTDATSLLEQQRTEFSDLIKRETKAWEALHKTYDDKLSLQKPVQYWTIKAKGHLCLSWAFGAAAAVVAGGVAWGVYDLLQIALKMPANVTDPANWHPEYWRVGVLLRFA